MREYKISPLFLNHACPTEFFLSPYKLQKKKHSQSIPNLLNQKIFMCGFLRDAHLLLENPCPQALLLKADCVKMKKEVTFWLQELITCCYMTFILIVSCSFLVYLAEKSDDDTGGNEMKDLSDGIYWGFVSWLQYSR